MITFSRSGRVFHMGWSVVWVSSQLQRTRCGHHAFPKSGSSMVCPPKGHHILRPFIGPELSGKIAELGQWICMTRAVNLYELMRKNKPELAWKPISSCDNCSDNSIIYIHLSVILTHNKRKQQQTIAITDSHVIKLWYHSDQSHLRVMIFFLITARLISSDPSNDKKQPQQHGALGHGPLGDLFLGLVLAGAECRGVVLSGRSPKLRSSPNSRRNRTVS